MQATNVNPASEIEIASDDHLANPVWQALAEAPSAFVERCIGGARYLPEFAPFGATPDYTPQQISQLADMLLPGQRLALVTPNKPQLPSDLELVREAIVYQMVCTNRINRSSDTRIEQLGHDDVAAMIRLAEMTEPGPFNLRTNELGHFFGIKEGGHLVAMAGERMTAGSYVEISAVCTHPEWRGRGLARLLMEHVAATIQDRNKLPMLHVISSNDSAIRLYRELGFRVARSLQLTAAVKPSKQVTR